MRRQTAAEALGTCTGHLQAASPAPEPPPNSCTPTALCSVTISIFKRTEKGTKYKIDGDMGLEQCVNKSLLLLSSRYTLHSSLGCMNRCPFNRETTRLQGPHVVLRKPRRCSTQGRYHVPNAVIPTHTQQRSLRPATQLTPNSLIQPDTRHQLILDRLKKSSRCVFLYHR